MNISTTGVAAPALDARNPFQQRRVDFQVLKGALANGNLDRAQAAFDRITALYQPTSGSAPAGGSHPVLKDWSALSTALSAKDLPSAQSVFATLQTDLRARLYRAHPGISAPVASSVADSESVLKVTV